MRVMTTYEVWDKYSEQRDSWHETRADAVARIERLCAPRGYDDLGREIVGYDPRDLEIRVVEY